MLDEGTIVEGYVIIDNGSRALLYFPKDRNGYHSVEFACGCLIWAKRTKSKSVVFVDADEDNNWLNDGDGFVCPELKAFLKTLKPIKE